MKKVEAKKIRTFSIDFKRGMVKKYEEGKITVLEISKLYDVSLAAIYKWIKKYSKLPPTEKYVIEHKSEGKKQMELLGRIKDLEQLVGQQQMELFYLGKVIDYGSEKLGEDLKKKVDTKW